MIVVAIIGILAAISIPNFMKFQARARQSEAKTLLKAYYQTQKTFFAHEGRYSNFASEIGWRVERNNRYSYYTSSNPTNGDNRSTAAENPPSSGVSYDYYPADTFRGYEVGSIPTVRCGGTIGVSDLVGTDPPSVAVAAATGNLDGDSTFDVWTISTAPRVGSTACESSPGGAIGAGEAANDVNDVDH